MSPKYTSKQTSNKGVAWLYSEVCALLDVWADHDIQQQLAGRLHNMCVYDKISRRLLSLGIDRTGEQCREKIKKLKRDYKTVVDNNYAPAFARKLLGCYDKVHEVFGKCAVIKPPFVIESILVAEGRNNGNSTKQMKIEDPEDGSKDFVFIGDTHVMETKATDHHYDSDTESGDDSEGEIICHTSELQDLDVHKNSKRRKISESAHFENFARQQNDIKSRFFQMEEKRLKIELELERQRLQMAERRRQQERQREIRLFQSLLSVITNKQKEPVLKFTDIDQSTGHIIHSVDGL